MNRAVSNPSIKIQDQEEILSQYRIWFSVDEYLI